MSTDNPSNDSSSFVDLDVALKKFSNHPYVRQWSPDKSVFKLLYIFCLPELDANLTVIKLLSARSENLEMITLRCVEEREVAQLAALLLFSWDRLVAPYADKGVENSPIAQHIKELMRQDLELRRLYNPKCQPIKKKTHLTSAWDVLTVLEHVRGILHSYREMGWAKYPYSDVPYHIAYDIWCYATDVWERQMKLEDVYSDDIPCLRPQLHPKDKAALDEALESQMRFVRSSMTDLPVSCVLYRMPPVDDGSVELYGDDIDWEKIWDLSREDDPELHHDMLTDAMWRLIEDDDKDFVDLINLSKRKKELLSDVADKFCMEDAAECFGSILDGEADWLLTVCSTVCRDAPAGWTLLHEAAKNSATGIILLLLQSGFAPYANTTSNCCELNLVQALPLELSLANLRAICLEDWPGRKFAVGLIIRLSQERMSNILESVRLLARKTNDVKQLFWKYLMEGKMVEVGALLMVAHKQLLYSPGSVGFRSIGEMHYMLSSNYVDDRSSSPVAIRSQSQCVDAFMEKKEALKLLEIFDKIGDKLTAYIQLERRLEFMPQRIAVEIVAILEDAGFAVTHKETYMSMETYMFRRCQFEESLFHKDNDTSSLMRLNGGITEPSQTLYDKQPSATQPSSFTPSKPAKGPLFDIDSHRRQCVPVCDMKFITTLKAKPFRSWAYERPKLTAKPLIRKYLPAMRLCAHIGSFARKLI